MFDKSKKAIITKRAVEKKQINWVLKDIPHNPEDSGWQLFYGNENDDYLNDPLNSIIITLEDVLIFQPQLETVFGSSGVAFDWNSEQQKYVENKIYNNHDAIMEQARKDQAEFEKRQALNQNTGVKKKWWAFWK